MTARISHKKVLILCLLFLAVLPAVKATQYFYNKYRWDIYERYGAVGDGSSDAYDGMYWLYINGRRFYANSWHIVDNGRGIWIEGTIQGLKVIRYIYIPPSPEMWARWVEYIENPGTSPVTVTIEIRGNLGSDGLTKVWGTSDGDTVMENTDTWIGTDDWDGRWDPTLVHWMGYNRVYTSRSYDNLYFRWKVTINPGESVALVWWAIQAPNQATARSIAKDIQEAVENEDTTSKYFEHLDEPDKMELLVNVINLPFQFAKIPRLRVEKVVNKTEALTWEYIGVEIKINSTPRIELEPNKTYTFERITIKDGFPTRFKFLGKVEEDVKKIALNIEKRDSEGNIIVSKTIYVPVSIEGDNYIFELEPTTSELKDLLKMGLNELMTIKYVIIPKYAGTYTLPPAEVSYYVNETVIS